MRLRPLATSLALAALTATVPGAARAAYIVTFSQVSGDVIATGSGTINTTGLRSNGDMLSSVSSVYASLADVYTGSNAISVPYFTTISGPQNFGAGTFKSTNIRTGDSVGLIPEFANPAEDRIYVPAGYISGTLLTDTATYVGQTFASLGLTPGSYIYNFNSGVNADTFTVNIGGSASVAVPEATSLSLLGTGFAGLLGLALTARRRKIC